MYTSQRDMLVLYTTAVCNLNCSYCYIDKNPALKKIDDMLDESFKGDYYFDFTKEIFPDPNQLRQVQIWGGEPTLRLDRCFYTIDKLIQHYPNLDTFMFSTNFVGEYWFDMVSGFLDILKKYEPRHFDFVLQLSIDGPPRINDCGRGVGVTEKFLKNYKELVKRVKAQDWVPKNVLIKSHFKPTLSTVTIPMLQTKESVIEYYRFLDTCADAIIFYTYENFDYSPCIPNVATPSPHTKQDGIMFANLCKLCREIEKEHLFKHYEEITPFWNSRNAMEVEQKHLCPNFTEGCNTCGIGIRTVGLLPDKKISLCHNGFVDLVGDYKKRCIENEQLSKHSIDSELFNRNNDVRDTNCNLEEFQEYQKLAGMFENQNASFQMANMVNMIILLAEQNMIDKKYKNMKEAIEAARFLQTMPYCVRDSLGTTGSMILSPMGSAKLLLNGAKEYILNEYE